MPKAILISIQSEWVYDIFSGKKTIEIRKTIPKRKLPIDVYIYCTKNAPRLAQGWTYCNNALNPINLANGKVIAKFTLNKINRYDYGNMDYPMPAYEGDPTCKKVGDGYWIKCGELERTCLTYEELLKYGKGKTLYGWHICNLEKFDKYKNLSDFYINNATGLSCREKDEKIEEWLRVKKAPQSWCYVEVE